MRGCTTGAQDAPAAAHPRLGDMLSFIAARHLRLAARADAAETLALPPGAMSALISFLRTCRKQRAAAGRPTLEADFEAFTGSRRNTVEFCSMLHLVGAGCVACRMTATKGGFVLHCSKCASCPARHIDL